MRHWTRHACLVASPSLAISEFLSWVVELEPTPPPPASGPIGKMGKKSFGFFRVFSGFPGFENPETPETNATGGVVQAFAPHITFQGCLYWSLTCFSLVTSRAWLQHAQECKQGSAWTILGTVLEKYRYVLRFRQFLWFLAVLSSFRQVLRVFLGPKTIKNLFPKVLMSSGPSPQMFAGLFMITLALFSA